MKIVCVYIKLQKLSVPFCEIGKENLTRVEGLVNTCEILIARREGKDPLRTPRRRCEDNIKMVIK